MKIAPLHSPLSKPAPTPNRYANFIASQLGWWACVLGGASSWSMAGTALVVIAIMRHIMFAARPLEEAKLIVATTLIGAVFDTALIQCGWIEFDHGVFIEGFAPHWMLALWALFATTFNISLAWLKSRLALAVVLGAGIGPLTYWGGARLGAAELLQPLPLFSALAIGWALVIPALMLLARRYDGYRLQ